MNKLIHLRGGSGSGKTSTVKSFISRGNYKLHSLRIGKKSYPFMYDEKQEIICTGKYDENNCCGLDGKIKDVDLMNKYLWRLMKDFKPKLLVFEAVMYGKTFKFGYELHHISRKLGYKYIGILLNPELNVVYQNIQKRNGGKPILEDKLAQAYFGNLKATQRLREKGVYVKIVDTMKFKKDELYKIIEEYVEE